MRFPGSVPGPQLWRCPLQPREDEAEQPLQQTTSTKSGKAGKDEEKKIPIRLDQQWQLIIHPY